MTEGEREIRTIPRGVTEGETGTYVGISVTHGQTEIEIRVSGLSEVTLPKE